MSRWDKISVYKFQQIERINNENKDELDRLLFTVCTVFDKTEFELDNMPLKRANRLINKTKKIFESEIKPVAFARLNEFDVTYNFDNITFGQFIELAHYMPNPIINAHLIMASITGTEGHKQRGEYFLSQPISKVIGCIQRISETYKDFLQEFNHLFGLDKEQHGEEVQEDKFMKTFGWFYSAEQLAAYFRVSLNEVFALKSREALNGLVYLKAKAKFEYEQSQQRKHGR